MKTSASIVNIANALVMARGNFPPILKTKTAEIKAEGKTPYSFSYAPLDEILHAITPHLQAHGLMLMQGFDGFNLETTLLHTSGEFITHSMQMAQAYPSPRAFGSELSYRRRYSVTSVLGLAAEDDDDGQAAESALGKRGKNAPPSGSVADVKKDAWEAADPKEQEFLRKIWANMLALLDEKRDDEALIYYRNQKLDADEQLAIQHLFESRHRTALRKAGERLAMANAVEKNREAA